MTEQERAKASAEAYQKLRQELDNRLKADSRLAQIAEKIKAGKAGFQDTAEYSEIVSKHLAQVIQDGIGKISNPAGLQMVCESLLKDHYEAINDVLGSVQTVLDEQCGIHIRPQKAEYPEERVQTLAHSLVDPTVAAETIHRRAGAPVENAAKSMHDDYMKENAKFRSDAGLECWIVRATDGKCCAWCTSMAGRYLYGTEPQDVYRRHDNCGCTVIYENGRQRQDVWTKKSWEVKDAPKKSAKPVRLDYKQGKELEKRNLSQFRGLTSGAESGIMKLKDSGDRLFPDVADKAPRLAFFEDDDLNARVENAANSILEMAKVHKIGTEFGYVINSEPPYTIGKPIVGEEGAMSVKIPRCSSPSVTLHNHPSGEAFSARDIDRFVIDEKAKAMCVIGNNGNWYVLEKTDSFDWFTYQMSVLEISGKDDFAKIIMEGAEKYGFRYYEKSS